MTAARAVPGQRGGRGTAAWLIAGACSASTLAVSLASLPARAQAPPNKTEIGDYKGLFAATIRGDINETQRLLAAGANPNVSDAQGRTPFLVAAHRSAKEIAWALVKGGANPNATDNRHYDAITIAAVRNDAAFVRLALVLGANPKAITSPYDGTALIAAAHLGHDEVVRALIKAGAPVDHVNNVGWTALIEAIVLGDGGARHQACVKALLEGRANPNLPDRNGASPLTLSRQRGYTAIAEMIERAGGT